MPQRAAGHGLNKFTQGAKTAMSPNWTIMSLLFNVVLPYRTALPMLLKFNMFTCTKMLMVQTAGPTVQQLYELTSQAGYQQHRTPASVTAAAAVLYKCPGLL